MAQQFLFPEDTEVFSYVDSLDHLHELLLSLNSISLFKLKMIHKRYIYARCSDCTAELRYKKKGGTFELFKANVKHKHIASRSKTKKNEIMK